jgi:hypothetical protein
MKRIILSICIIFSLSVARAQITDTSTLRSYINNTIIPNVTKSISATQMSAILNGNLNVLPGLLKRYYDSIWIAAGNLYVRKNGITNNFSLIGAEIDPYFTASPAYSISNTDKTHWTAAYDRSLTGISFPSGTLTLAKQDGTFYTVSLDGRYNKLSDTASMLSVYLRSNVAAATYEPLANKATDFSTVNNTLYPTVQASKTYMDALVVGLLNDRGNWDASGNVFPTTGGSGSSGAIKKGNLWFISVAGTLGGTAVRVGDQIRALVDAPGQTASNWGTMNGAVGYIPENQANKSTSTSLGTSDVAYPTQNAVKSYVDSRTTTNIAEGTNLYYTDARARAAISPGSGMSYNNITGVFTNIGVRSVAGTANQVITSAASGDITLSLPQSICTTCNVTFNQVTASLVGNATTVTNGVYTTGSYANPAWITSLVWSKITSTPTTLAGYGITDAMNIAGGTFTGGINGTSATFSGIGSVGDLVTTGVGGNAGSLQLLRGPSILGLQNGYVGIYADNSNDIVFNSKTSGTLTSFILSYGSITSGTTKAYTLPNANGTFALTSDLTNGSNVSFGIGAFSGLLSLGTGDVTNMPTPTNALGVFTSSASSGANISAIFRGNQTAATTGSMQGVEGYVKASHTSGTVAAIIGAIGNIEVNGAGGTTTWARSVQGGGVITAGSVPNWARFYASAGSGTATNNYSLFAETGAGGLYINDASTFVSTVTAANLRAAATNTIGWTGQGGFESVSNGNYKLYNEARNTYGNLTLGAVTINYNTQALNMVGTFPYLSIQPSGWSGNYAFIQAGVDATGVSTGDYVYFSAPSGKHFKFDADITSAGIITAANKLILYGGSSATVGGGTLVQLYDQTNNRGWIVQQSAAYNLDLWSYNSGWGLVGEFSNSTGAYNALSDSTKKKDFEPMTSSGLDAVMKLKPTLYRMKTEGGSVSKHLYFIAQEVKNVIPQAYVEHDGFIGLQDQAIIATMVKAIQELQNQVTELQQQVLQLSNTK